MPYFTKNTKGWKEEKKKMREQAFENSKKKIIKSFEIKNEELLSFKKSAFDACRATLNSVIKEEVDEKGNKTGKKFYDVTLNRETVSSLEKLINIFKTELGEPTSISNNNNNNNKNDNKEIGVVDILRELRENENKRNSRDK